MGRPTQAISSILEHAPTEAIEGMHLPGVNVFVDDPAIHSEAFYGTDGQTDVFVFDAKDPGVNATLLRNFDAGEDLLLFKSIDGRDLTVGDLGTWSDGSPVGMHFVLFDSTGGSANIVLFDVPYQQDTIESMVLPFNGQLVFDDPFALV